MSTLDILVNPSGTEDRKDSVVADDKCCAERPTSQPKTYERYEPNVAAPAEQFHRKLTQSSSMPLSMNNRAFSNNATRSRQATSWRQISYGGASVPDDRIFEDDDDLIDENTPATRFPPGPLNDQPQRTLYFSGLSDRTTYKDLLSIIKGGKVISVVLRNGSAVVTLASGASDFLAWSRRNDIYLQGKRVSIGWIGCSFIFIESC